MSAVKQILKGDEILNEFGPLPRSDLLRRYGYISANYKKWDVVEVDSNKILGIVRSKGQLGIVEIADRVSFSANIRTSITHRVCRLSLQNSGRYGKKVLT